MSATAAGFVIDIVVPVYNAPDDVRICVASVLAHLRPDVRLVLIDDASPDPRDCRVFRGTARRARIRRCSCCATSRTWASPARRIAGCNCRARMSCCSTRTRSSRAGWLDALMHCAATDARIGTITPFSNNAEICSFPRFCEDNPWPAGADPEPVRAALAAVAVPTYPDLPTGVGFCMYVRRALLDDVGIVRPGVRAGLRRGERPVRARGDGRMAQRARRQRVRRAHRRAFVRRPEERIGRAQHGAAGRAPSALSRHGACLHRRRSVAAAARWRRRCGWPPMPPPGRGVLHVIHHHGGGTETHVRALIAGSRERWRHYLAIAVDDRWQVEEHRADGTVVTFATRPRAARALARLRRRHLRDLRHRAHPPAQHLRLSRGNPARAGDASRSLRLHGPRSQFRVPDDHVSRRRWHVLRRADRHGDLHALPQGAAGVRSRRHRRVARPPSANCSGGRRSGSRRRSGRPTRCSATFRTVRRP